RDIAGDAAVPRAGQRADDAACLRLDRRHARRARAAYRRQHRADRARRGTAQPDRAGRMRLSVVDYRSLNASRTPSRMKRPPIARSSHARTRPNGFNDATFAANHATPRHHKVPLRVNTRPSARNASTFEGASGSMNCGRKARKNSATFGLRTLVRKPWQKTTRSGTDARASPGAPAASARSWPRATIMRIPRQTRYAAPIHLTAA